MKKASSVRQIKNAIQTDAILNIYSKRDKTVLDRCLNKKKINKQRDTNNFEIVLNFTTFHTWIIIVMCITQDGLVLHLRTIDHPEILLS